MKKVAVLILALLYTALTAGAEEMNIETLLQTIEHDVLGNRARDYTMRLWQYEK